MALPVGKILTMLCMQAFHLMLIHGAVVVLLVLYSRERNIIKKPYRLYTIHCEHTLCAIGLHYML